MVFWRGDQEIIIDLPAKLCSNSVHVLDEFVLTGAGSACLRTLVCRDDLARGALVVILPDYELHPPLELLAIYPPTQRRSLKVHWSTRYKGEQSFSVPASNNLRGSGRDENNSGFRATPDAKDSVGHLKLDWAFGYPRLVCCSERTAVRRYRHQRILCTECSRGLRLMELSSGVRRASYRPGS